jgi:hypothetical protein
MRIAADEMLVTPRVAPRVPDRVNLVVRKLHIDPVIPAKAGIQ